MVGEIVLNVLRDNTGTSIVVENTDEKKSKKKGKDTATGEKKTRAPRIKSYDQIVCPVCGKGHIVKGKTAFGCSEYRNGCQTLFPFTDYPADLTPARLNQALKKLKK